MQYPGKNNTDNFSGRSRILLESVAALAVRYDDIVRMTMHRSLARLGLGTDSNDALQDIQKCNDMFYAGMAKDGCFHEGMFFVHVNIDAYLRFGDLYSDDLQERVRYNQVSFPYQWETGTENHKLMNAVSAWLTGQTWDVPSLQAGSRLYLENGIDRITRYGLGEFDSPTYGIFYLNTFATLYDFTRDLDLRQKCREVLDLLLNSMSNLWFKGMYVGAHSRDYFPLGSESCQPAIAGLWLYCGGIKPCLSLGEPFYAVINALSHYRAPREIEQRCLEEKIQQDIIETCDMTGLDSPTHDGNQTHILGDAKGFGYISRAGVTKYTYIDGNYALSSMTDGKTGDIIWSGQMRRWSLDWYNGHTNSVLFFTHPFPDGPDDTDYRQRLIGSSPYEQVFQYHNTLLALYSIPQGEEYKYAPRRPVPSDADPYIEGIFTKAITQIIEKDNWVFCHGGTIMAAIRPLKSYYWTQEMVSRGCPHTRLHSDGCKNGLVMEVENISSDDNDEAFQDFIMRILCNAQSGLSFNLNDENPRICYANLGGSTLEFTFNGERIVSLKEMQCPSK